MERLQRRVEAAAGGELSAQDGVLKQHRRQQSGGDRHQVRMQILDLSLQLHPPVLEPDFDLPVSEVHTAADLQATLPCQVHVEEKLLLQLQSLVLGVGAALLSATLSREPVSRTFYFSISCDENETGYQATGVTKTNNTARGKPYVCVINCGMIKFKLKNEKMR